jgi:hypothetical protein
MSVLPVQTTPAADAFTVSRTLENGIERIVYHPRQRRFQTPLLMQHGM